MGTHDGFGDLPSQAGTPRSPLLDSALREGRDFLEGGARRGGAVNGAAQQKPRRQSLEPGMTIAERYVVQRILGQGGMGQVLEVEHLSLGRRFALKVLRLERWNDELVRRFNREARALAKLTTPRVAQVTDFGIDEESGPFYVMELLEGETLEDRLERGPLSPQDALTIGAATCDALADCHAAGIVHRDLKPSNIGIAESGPVAVKLLDFGLAASMDEAFLSKITQSQQILGSLPYMAPEQFNAAPAAASMDIYAVGICLYEALSGRLPFMAPSTAALIHQILSTPVPPLPSELAGAGPLEGLLERLLAKEPERRFASARAAGAAMREVLKALGASAAHPLTRGGAELVPATVQAEAVDSDRVGRLPTLMAESGTRLSSPSAVAPVVASPAPSAPPGVGQSVVGQPVQGLPVQGLPVQGQPVQGQPVQGQPVQGQPVQGQPVEGAPPFEAWQSGVIPPTPPAGSRPFAGGVTAPPIAASSFQHHGLARGETYPPLAHGAAPHGAPLPPPTNVHGHQALAPTATEPAGLSPWIFRVAVAGLLGLIAAGLLTIGIIVAMTLDEPDADLPPPPALAPTSPAAPEPVGQGLAQPMDPSPPVQATGTEAPEAVAPRAPEAVAPEDTEDTEDTEDEGPPSDGADRRGREEPPRAAVSPERRGGHPRATEPAPAPQIRPLGPGPSPGSATTPPPRNSPWQGGEPINTYD